MGITKVRANQIYGLPESYMPYLYEVVPESNLPGTTSDFMFNGAFYTPSTTVTVSGQTVNSVTFISDNVLKVNITLGQTEGSFAATINNGQSKTFSDVILVVLGTVYSPVTSDFSILSGNADFGTKGEMKIISNGQDAKAILSTNNFLIPSGIDFEIRFRMRVSPIDTSPQFYSRICGVELINPIDSSLVIGLWRWAENMTTHARTIFFDDTTGQTKTQATNVPDIAIIKVQRVNGVYTFKTDETVRYISTETYAGDLRIRLNLHDVDIAGIKFIELAN